MFLYFILLLFIQNIYCFNISGINYNVRIGPDWDYDKCKAIHQIESELLILKNITNNIKIFSLTDCNQGNNIINIANKLNLNIWLGLWVSNDTSIFINEKKELINLINLNLINNSNILGFNIGSESIYRNEITVEENINYMLDIKKLLLNNNIYKPVSLVDTIDIYIDNPIIIEKSDLIIINQFPFWEKININDSIDYFNNKLNKLQNINNLYNKKIIIGETGWSSNGFNKKASEANKQNHATYFINFYNYIRNLNIEYFYFSAFDEPWKNIQNNDTEDVESHFGLFYENGIMKEEIYNIINLNNYTIKNTFINNNKTKNNKTENNKTENNNTENNQNINTNQSSKEIISIKLIILSFLVILIHI
jgi:glucan 1,3-beta-glucosidase